MNARPGAPKTILFVANVDWFFLSHRLPIAVEAVRQGYVVHVAAAITNGLETLRACGIVVHPLQIERSSMGVLAQLKLFWQLVRLFKAVRPDLVHLITVKPVLIGGLAARVTGVPAVLAAVSGLGFLFVSRGAAASLRRLLIGALYRLALGKRNLKALFQNISDRDLVARLAGLGPSQCAVIRGSGVDLRQFAPQAWPMGVPVVLLAGRLLGDKGVREFVQASRLLKRAGAEARFCLVGAPDPANPASIGVGELEGWRAEGVVEWWGHHSDMVGVLAQASIVVLPSYREGLPKVLIEAAASGRPVVTTDVPGCRDAIEPGVTGLLVPLHSVQALADAMQSLLDDPVRCQHMGSAGRRLAEAEFDVATVVARHFAIYRELLL